MTESDDRLTRKTPSQAEGERDDVRAALDPSYHDAPDDNPPMTTPSKAEGTRETVNEALDEQEQTGDE